MAGLPKTKTIRVTLDWDKAPLDVPLWCVYGPECFPTVFLCKIKDHPDVGRVIWGYSVYRRSPGFRTLGTGREWLLRNDAILFATPTEAFSHIASLFRLSTDNPSPLNPTP